MYYTLYFLLGMPLWLIPVAYVLRHREVLLAQRAVWATMTFLAPFLIFGLGAFGKVIVEQRFGADSPRAVGFGYLIALINTLAFISPLIMQGMFRHRYGVHQRVAAT